MRKNNGIKLTDVYRSLERVTTKSSSSKDMCNFKNTKNSSTNSSRLQEYRNKAFKIPSR
ncbi:hypothetical protein [Clostridium tyrobutyricum]|uniref:hypothetical protein n=1 Tax=Clostridium tyrobutyricum TaxID=1519 RepID=UPI000A7D6457|nr:hypothetical protein [Clostridium tyrobutyricum]